MSAATDTPPVAPLDTPPDEPLVAPLDTPPDAPLVAPLDTPPDAPPVARAIALIEFDAIFPGSVIMQMTQPEAPTDAKNKVPPFLNGIQPHLIALFTALFPTHDIIIISTADDGWVEFAVRRFMPLLVPYIQPLPIYYVKSRHSAQFPNHPMNQLYAGVSHIIDIATPKPSKILCITKSGWHNEIIRSAVRYSVDDGVICTTVGVSCGQKLVEELQVILGNLPRLCNLMVSSNLSIQL